MAEMEVSPQEKVANPQGMKVFAVERPVWVLGRDLKLTREHLAVAPCRRLTQFLYH